MTTTVLISGGNRGLGLGLVKGYAARPNHTVIATVRNPSSMPDVPTAEGSKVVTVQMEATNVNDPKKAIEEIKSKYGVTKLDIIICSAAIMKDTTIADMKDIDPAVFEEHWRVNVLGFLTFFQACVPLLQPGAKFVFMSSGSSILDRIPDNNNVCYGITKAGANYLGRYAHFEHQDLIIFPMSPGWVETDMGTVTRDRFVPDKKLLSVDDSVGGMIKVIDEATRETHSGKHMRYDGSVSKW